jgi:ribosome-binding ATPase YchF (GTP1/OBG family)
MRRVVFIFLSLLYFLPIQSNAAVYKGQKYFVKTCVKCHESGQGFVAQHTIKEWNKWMNKKGKILADLHLQDAKAEESHSYFESKAFSKQSKHLQQFLIEYAKDSGNVPACN